MSYLPVIYNIRIPVPYNNINRLYRQLNINHKTLHNHIFFFHLPRNPSTSLIIKLKFWTEKKIACPETRRKKQLRAQRDCENKMKNEDQKLKLKLPGSKHIKLRNQKMAPEW